MRDLVSMTPPAGIDGSRRKAPRTNYETEEVLADSRST
jgi:hypothetical protein